MALAAVAAGAFGGWLAFSWLIGKLPFASGDSAGGSPPVQITQREEVKIQENSALKDAVAKASGIAAGVKVVSTKGAASYGSGVILTSDGVMAVPNSLFPAGANAEITAAGKKVVFEVLKRDKTLNLAIIKLENASWPTAGFYVMENLKLGERVFLLGTLAGGGSFTSEGIVRNFDGNSITTSIWEKNEALGSPVFDIEGNILGMAVPDKSGLVSVIPIWTIKTFAGL